MVGGIPFRDSRYHEPILISAYSQTAFIERIIIVQCKGEDSSVILGGTEAYCWNTENNASVRFMIGSLPCLAAACSEAVDYNPHLQHLMLSLGRKLTVGIKNITVIQYSRYGKHIDISAVIHPTSIVFIMICSFSLILFISIIKMEFGCRGVWR